MDKGSADDAGSGFPVYDMYMCFFFVRLIAPYGKNSSCQVLTPSDSQTSSYHDDYVSVNFLRIGQVTHSGPLP